jgi:L-lysine 2,3-aminomutase
MMNTEESSMTTLTRSTLQILGQRVAEAGVDADPAAITELAEAALHTGIHPVVIEVLLDETSPMNVRIRAFAKVSCAVACSLYAPTRASVAAAA